MSFRSPNAPPQQQPSPRLGALARVLRFSLRHRLRGSTRGTFFLAQHLEALRAVPITIGGTQTLYVDLRDGLSHDLLAGTPWRSVPWEVDEQLVMRRLVRPGDVVFDVGAHIGLHLVFLAELVGPTGRVHAFEPNPGKTPALSKTVAALPNATLHHVGLADREAVLPLFVPGDESMSSLADWTAGRVGAVKQRTCEVRRLDDLLAARSIPLPDFVKCDVEGAEHLVFAGAIRTLDRADAPIILYEANTRAAKGFGVPLSTATDRLRGLAAPGYDILHVQDGGHLVPIEHLGEGCGHYNLVAMPASRRGRLRTT